MARRRMLATLAVAVTMLAAMLTTGLAGAASAGASPDGIRVDHGGTTVGAPGATAFPAPSTSISRPTAPDPLRTPHGVPPKLGGTENATMASYNWSGKIDTGTRYTAVSGQWTVPSVVPSTTLEFSASWIGIGGVGTTALIQAGTTSATATGVTTYYAWYELLPTTSVTIGGVAPGDLMRAAIVQNAATTWTISIEDVTQGNNFTKTFTYTAGTATSAEWIVERPAFLTTSAPTGLVLTTLANFGTVRFTHMGISGTNPSTTTLSSAYMISTAPGYHVIAYPGPLGNGTTGNFTDHYGAPTQSVTSVSPQQGPTTGGTTVTITGTSLVPALVESVQFGLDTAKFTVDTSGVITAIAPPEPAGTVDVTVTTTDGTTAATSASRFTYVSPTSGSGYDLVGTDGGVFVFPTGSSGGFYGSLPGLGIRVDDVVGMVATTDDRGYFLVGADGGVFSFGDAPYLGSLPGLGVTPAQPITGIVPTGTDGGYFLVGKDGGVYAFGDAPYLGSLPGSGVHTDSVVGIAATPSGNGYWLVTATGTVYAYGAARQLGSATGTSSPVTAIAGTPTGGGYWIVTQNGAVYAFGNAGYFGSLPGIGISPARPVIGVVHTSGTGGYWLIGSDGGIFAFGTAPFVGSLPGLGVDVSDIVGAVPTSP